MPGITISSGFGAGGSIVAPVVAERLGLQLLDRAISVAVASQLNVSVEEAQAGAPNRSFIERLLTFMSPLASDSLGTPADLDATSASAGITDEAAVFRDEAERLMRAAFADGAVVLGRAGAAAFRDAPDILRVRLFGAVDARLERARAGLGGIDRGSALKQLKQVDHARDQYVRRLYHISVDDPEVFQLQIDSTVLPLEGCAEVIITAYRALLG
jgi:cytidylate kinase